MPYSDFSPRREAALDRLAQFVPHAGREYTAGRNTDPGADREGAVSRLSPYIRYRMLTEHEVVAAVLQRHSLAAADKFVAEVLWRTYWKGWLELRPAVWARFLAERDRQRTEFTDLPALVAAESGNTGIAGFDDWARELAMTGYLHNHVRMWFASIWIFTLRLPWTLGADFFMRHLADADAASNTLSWRWVAGLQTAGKTYLAKADNIARHTEGRFKPKGLSTEAIALTEPPLEKAGALPSFQPLDPAQPALLLLTPEDVSPETLVPASLPISGAIVAADDELLWGENARHFVREAAADAALRVASHFSCATEVVPMLDAAGLIAAAQAHGVRQIVTPYAPVGPVADALAQIAPVLADEGVTLAQSRRAWDAQFWSHATKGFFPFKERVPAILRQIGLT